jgi:hypothetical protein
MSVAALVCANKRIQDCCEANEGEFVDFVFKERRILIRETVN